MRRSGRVLAASELLSAATLTLAEPAGADDAYYSVPITQLTITQGSLPTGSAERAHRRWRLVESMRPYAVLDGPGEVYVQLDRLRFRTPINDTLSEATLAVRAPAGRDVSGRLFVPQAGFRGMVRLRFTIPSSQAHAEARQAYLRAKEAHYRRLLQRDVPGGAWFRKELADAVQARTGKRFQDVDEQAGTSSRRRGGRVEDTYALLSGGRAISENLQLDRLLPNAQGDEATIDVSSLTGITVRELDWGPLLTGKSPQLDPLANNLPADQHALFFPSFSAMVEMMDEAQAHGTPILHLAQPRSEDARVKDRYERQLCLSVDAISRLLGPQVVASVAFTGSDAYLPTGSDIAVLFEAKKPEVLGVYLAGKYATVVKQLDNGAKAVSGTAAGTSYQGVRTADRSICSYSAMLGNVVIVSNSIAQLERIVKATKKELPAMASLPEYRFFRTRYSLSDADETAFLMITDAAIRRWCGPQWRIAASRRLRAAAVMSHLQAVHLDDLVRGKVQAGPIGSDFKVPGLGDLQLTRHGVQSFGLWHAGVCDSDPRISPSPRSPSRRRARTAAGAMATSATGAGFSTPLPCDFPSSRSASLPT